MLLSCTLAHARVVPSREFSIATVGSTRVHFLPVGEEMGFLEAAKKLEETYQAAMLGETTAKEYNQLVDEVNTQYGIEIFYLEEEDDES